VISFFRVVSRYSPAAQQKLLTDLKLLNNLSTFLTIADVIQLKSSYTACLQFKQTLNKAACDVQETVVRTNFHTQKITKKTKLHYCFEWSMVRTVHGANSPWYE